MTLTEISLKDLEVLPGKTLQVSDEIAKVYSNIYVVAMTRGVEYQFEFDIATDPNRNLSFRCKFVIADL